MSCTWLIRLGNNGTYVVDPDGHELTYDAGRAHLWLDEERAHAHASRTPWIAASQPQVRRARP